MSSQFPGVPDGPEHSIHVEVPTREVTPEQESILVRAISSLGDRMIALGKKLGTVEQLAQRTKRMTSWIIGIGAGLALLFAAVLVVFGVAITAKNDSADAVDIAKLNTQYLTAQCDANNQTRADQRELWGAIIAVSAEGGANDPVVQLVISKGIFTQEEYDSALNSGGSEAGTNFIKDKVATIFADRDCSKVAEGKVK